MKTEQEIQKQLAESEKLLKNHKKNDGGINHRAEGEIQALKWVLEE